VAFGDGTDVATVEDCENALHALADRLAATDPSRRKVGFDRSLSCTVRDLGVVFVGRLKDGLLTDITQASERRAQIQLTTTSDDLVGLVTGNLKVPAAWATKRLTVDASLMDMVRLKSIF
jgi:hypothetical protein